MAAVLRTVLREELGPIKDLQEEIRRSMSLPRTASGRRYLTVKEAAERVGVHPRTIRDRVDTGQLPACRSGRILRIQTDHLDALFNVQSPSESDEHDQGLAARVDHIMDENRNR